MNQNSGIIQICKIYRDEWQRNSYSLSLTAFECDDPSSFVSSTLIIQVLDNINKMFDYTIDGTTDNTFPKVIFDENQVITFDNSVTVSDPDEVWNIHGNLDSF